MEKRGSDMLDETRTQVSPSKKRKVSQSHTVWKENLEIEILEDGETHTYKLMEGCQKNPGHAHFIPVKSFGMEHLPKNYQDRDLFEKIKAVADLTVRVEVKMTSPHRPEFYPDTHAPYPCYNMRDKTTLRVGTGEIDVAKFIDGHGFQYDGNEYNEVGHKYLSMFDASTKTCPCTKCRLSEKPSNVWWELSIMTATYVVFDDIEASHTSCRLFYDEQDSPVVILDAVSVHYADIDRDMCRLKYVTCDSLGDKLYNMAVQRNILCEKDWSKYKSETGDKLVFIVSHPHGCHKHVSVGHLMDICNVFEYSKTTVFTGLCYSTGTCPGSSGAPVYCVGSWHRHYHRGCDDGFNFSEIGFHDNKGPVNLIRSAPL